MAPRQVILADTSVWISHLLPGRHPLRALLESGLVLMHPFVIGELAMGNLHERAATLDFLLTLPRPQTAFDADVLRFVEDHKFYGCGIGFVDAHLLVSARLSAALLWTADRRLHAAAASLGLGYAPAP